MANKGRNINTGELSLWQKMTQGIKSWHRDDVEVPKPSPREPSKGVPQPPRNRYIAPSKNVNTSETEQQLDRRTHEKLSRGKMPIEAMIDLHGMTQDQAFNNLSGFLLNAHQSGKRCVLVITGKGSRDLHDGGIVSERREKGVLRSRLPEWLKSPILKDIILKHVRATQKHGGDGAFYVYIKNRNKS